MSTTDAGSEVIDALEGATSVLLLSPSMHPDEDAACMDLLSTGRPGDVNAICVTLSDSPDDKLATWREHVGDERPNSLGFVAGGETTRSTAAATGGAGGGGGTQVLGSVSVDAVSNPGDLTEIGIRISSLLSEFAGGEGRVVVCFDSLTTLLQYTDLRTAFRFLHVVTGRFESVGALSHFHLDPTAHDDQTVNTLKQLFDAVVEVTDDGTTVTTRPG